MGYDIHVTRAIDWQDNQGQEISEQEWLALVETDSELALDPANGKHAVLWGGDESPSGAWFDWYKGNIFTTNPDRAVLMKALRIAVFLDAQVLGDDGKIYHQEDDWTQIPQNA